VALTSSIAEIVEKNFNGLLGAHHSWARFRLGDVADVQNGAPYDSAFFNSDGDGMPLLRIRDVGRDETDTFYSGPYDDGEIVSAGDLVIGMDGNFKRAIWEGRDVLLNQRVCRINFQSDLVNRRFVFLVLQGYLDAINEATPSITVKHLSSKTIADLLLPLPPRSEQDRIVAVLDTSIALIAGGVHDALEGLAAVEAFINSLYAFAAHGHETSDGQTGHNVREEILSRREQKWREAYPKKAYKTPQTPRGARVESAWPLMTLDELTEGSRRSAYGVLRPGDDVDDGVFLIRVGDLSRRGIVDAKLRRIGPDVAAEYERTALRGHELLVSLVGTVGRVAVAPKRLAGANVARAVGVFPLSDLVDSRYVSIVLSSPDAQNALVGEANEVARKTLNLDDLRGFAVPIPPLSVQRAVVEQIEVAEEEAWSLKEALTAAIQQAKLLAQSVVAHAMNGQLVPQARADEPAAALLSKIGLEKAERAKTKRLTKNVHAATTGG
jgi:type I restriction enzyme S subunit